VDTGSTDSTPLQAQALGAKVLSCGWNDSFAQARNVSLSAANEPWILVLDADERIASSDLAYIKDATERGSADGYHLIQRNYVLKRQVFGWTPNSGGYPEGNGYDGYVDNPLIRLFRNSPDIRFHGTVHEIIEPKRSPQFTFGSLPSIIHHYGKVRGEERVTAKQHLYLALGLKKIQEEPASAKAYFDLGIQYQELGRHAEACACFDEVFETTGIPTVLLYWAISEKHLGQYESAAALLARALEVGLDTFDVHLELGNVHLAKQDWKAAQAEYAKCLRLNEENPIAAFNYGLALRKMGDSEGAVKFYNRALEIDSKFREPMMELAVPAPAGEQTRRSAACVARSFKRCRRHVAHRCRTSSEGQSRRSPDASRTGSKKRSITNRCAAESRRGLQAQGRFRARSTLHPINSQNMKVAIYNRGIPFDGSTPFTQPLGGSETSIAHMARELARASHDVTVYSSRPNGGAGFSRPSPAETGTHAGVESPQYKGWNEFFQDYPAAGWDVVISFRSFEPFLTGRVAPRMIFWTGDAPDQPALQHFDHEALQNNIDLIFCVSEWHRRSFLEKFNLPRDKVVATRNGFCPEIIPPPRVHRDWTRCAYSSTPFRGLDVLLQMFPLMRQRTRR
jgi:tetratricopeptide (TPR) repeat protein